MFKRLNFLATFVCLFLSFTIFAEELNFINDDLKTGLNRAASEGKLVFLEFSANYCTPCKMMDEYTFTQPSVIERMNNGYVPVKVNIQSFDGFDLKNQYNVKVLPTIIILDSKGRQVSRYEETMSATKLNSVLDKHNLPQYRQRLTPVYANNNNSSGFNPQINKTNRVPDSPVPPSYNTTAQKITVPNSIQTDNAVVRARPNAVATSDIGQRKETPKNSFTIQVGAYSQLTGAKAAIEELKKKNNSQSQYIMQSKVQGKITYRVLVGKFATKQQAEAFCKKTAIEGMVKPFEDIGKK
ncbi:MAG: SPOR domain-containing protein [Saprospiraceae bacterium]|nr:SPOR domain-containing protein [Saprospiraceae bacterium]